MRQQNPGRIKVITPSHQNAGVQCCLILHQNVINCGMQVGFEHLQGKTKNPFQFLHIF